MKKTLYSFITWFLLLVILMAGCAAPQAPVGQGREDNEMREELPSVNDVTSDAPALTDDASHDQVPDYTGLWEHDASSNHSINVFSQSGQSISIEVSSIKTTYDGNGVSAIDVTKIESIQIVDGCGEKEYTDGWENRGVIYLEFSEDKLAVSYDHIQRSERARWGIDPGAGTYHRTEKAPVDTQSSQEGTGDAEDPGDAVFVPFSGNEQYEANIFLSNFSEQFFGDFDRLTASEAQVADFAYLYSKINARDALSHVMVDGVNYEAISLASVNSAAERFFGFTISPADGADYSDELGYAVWARCFYQAGTFYFPFASGEAYNRFSVVNERYARADGAFLLYFDIFALDIREYSTGGMSSALYSLSASEAEAMSREGKITLVQKGYAVVYPYNLNGRDTYRLTTYQITDQYY